MKVPIAFYVAGAASLVTFAIGGDAFWYRASYLALLVGVVTAVVAAVFGILDLTRVPRAATAKRTGTLHGGLTVGATGLFLAAALVIRSEWLAHGALEAVEIGLPLIFALVAVAMLGVGGALGLHLVSSEHMGISPLPGHAERIRLGVRTGELGALSSTDAIAVIEAQHDRIDSLVQSLRVAPESMRRALFVEVCNHVEAHAEMEEALFYRAFTQADGTHLTAYAADHRELRALLAGASYDRTDGAKFFADLAYIATGLAAHQAQEERELLPRVAAVLKPSEREVLGAEMLALHAQLLAGGVHRNIEAASRHTVRV